MKDLITELENNHIGISLNGNDLELSFDDQVPDAAILDKIRANKKDLISFMKKYARNQEYESIPLAAPADCYPVSNAQKRLWVMSQFKKNAAAYNIPNSIDLGGDLDIANFKRAIDSVIERHEILRTIFKENEAGELCQWILSPAEQKFEIEYQDFRRVEDVRSAIQHFIKDDTHQPFDLEKGPLLRGILLQVAEDHYVFYYNMHHIISDAWSMEILIKDTMTFYEAYSAGQDVDLKPLRIQYKDYAAWKASKLQGPTAEKHKAYWLEQLSGELPVLDLPSQGNRPKMMTSRGRRLKTYISSQTSLALKAICKAEGGSLFMGLLAAWNILFYRYTQQEDILLGTTVGGREHTDLEDQIGFYVNTLALRNTIQPKEGFIDFFKRLKEATLMAFSHHIYPFDRLVEELGGVRNTSRNPLVDAVVTLQNTQELEAIKLEEAAFHNIEDKGACLSKFDLNIDLLEIGDCIGLDLIYNSDIYDQSMIEQMIRHFKRLLASLVKNPEMAVGEINYMSCREKSKLLVDFNDTIINHPSQTLIDLFKKQLKESPAATAIEFASRRMSYKDLDEKSNQLANYLLDNGLVKGDLVPLCMERSLDLMVSIFALFKCGAIYVPIESSHPAERIQYILSDTEARTILITSGVFEKLNFDTSVDVIAVDTLGEDLSKGSVKAPKISLSAEDLAYIIYTSGTSGQAKGVKLSHGNLGAFLANIEHRFRAISSQPVLASNSFDISLFELFNPLLSGGRAILLSSEEIKNIDTLLSILQNVSAFHAVPALMTQIIQAIEEKGLQEVFARVKELYTGGDVVPAKLIEDMRRVFPKATIRVFYGPTESTVFVTSKKYVPSDQLEKGTVIGMPNVNTQTYILDANHSLCPVGVIGELCVSGHQVSQGYLNRPALNAEKFIENPYIEGARLYKTGDLAKWMPDGNIEFVGRADNQVKIRGHRIELGEVEYHLQNKPDIDDAIVMVRETTIGDKELVAYVTSTNIQNTAQLHDFLSTSLPSYMLPAYYVQLEQMPLTRNGKMDRKALPEPAGISISSGVDYVAPSNEVEEKLVAIWEEYLLRDQIGIYDNFFHIGGDSIKGIKIISEIQKKFNVKIDIGTLFLEPTIKALSAEVALKSWYSHKTINEEAVDKLVI